jgi:hypothetical protein
VEWNRNEIGRKAHAKNGNTAAVPACRPQATTQLQRAIPEPLSMFLNDAIPASIKCDLHGRALAVLSTIDEN